VIYFSEEMIILRILKPGFEVKLLEEQYGWKGEGKTASLNE
jgi:hypothetical protein